MFQIKVVGKIKNTSHVQCLFSKNCAVYEIKSKNVVEPERPQTIWPLNVASLESKAAHTHAHVPICKKYVILIAFHVTNVFINAPQCYITHTLPVVL
jgi:hypothetical protein